MTEHPSVAESLAVGRELMERVDQKVDFGFIETAAEYANVASAHLLLAIATKLVEG